MPTRLISFAGSTIAIAYEGARPEYIVNFLTRDIVPALEEADPHITFQVAVDDRNQLCLFQAEQPSYEADSDAKIAQALLGNSGFQLADRSRGGLLFHAGGVAWHDCGILLPGMMGAGKTTLTAWLLTKGFHYLTDELVFFPQGGLTLQGFNRPLNIKSPSRPVLETIVDFQADPRLLSTTATTLVPAELFNPNTTYSQPVLHLIIFPMYQADSQFKCQRLTPAQTGLGLMQCLINARNLPEHGFPEISRLAQSVPAYKMTYAGFSQVGNQVEMLLKPG